MLRGRQLALGHAVTAPPVRDGPGGIADSGRDRPRAATRDSTVDLPTPVVRRNTLLQRML
jgi:hypothetical protein